MDTVQSVISIARASPGLQHHVLLIACNSVFSEIIHGRVTELEREIDLGIR